MINLKGLLLWWGQHVPCVSALLAKPEQPVVWIGTLWTGHRRDPDSGHCAKGLGRDEKEK